MTAVFTYKLNFLFSNFIFKLNFKFQIAAQPRDGEANNEVHRYICEIFKLKNRQVSLINGHKSRQKVILLEQLDEIVNILEQNKI